MRIPMLLWLIFAMAPFSSFSQNNCQINDLTVAISPLDPSFCAFNATINFQHQNTTNQFVVGVNGTLYGPYAYNQLPLVIGPITNDNSGLYKFLVSDAVFTGCTEDVQVQTPICGIVPCGIVNFTASPDTCTSDSTYNVLVDFDAVGSTSSSFDVFAGAGIFIGTYQVGQLPLLVNDFPWSGNAFDVIKVCFTGNPLCCVSDTLTPPNCLPGSPCALKDLSVKPDTCTSDSTYLVSVDFQYNASSSLADSFSVYANDSLIGIFPANQLPLKVEFPWGGKVFDRLRVCLVNSPNCCKEVQILAPNCLPFGPCMVMSADIKTGPCTSDSSYNITVNFQATNPGLGTFKLFGNGGLLGSFKLEDVPLLIKDFKWNGQMDDFIRICIDLDTAANGSSTCCETFKFEVPDCLFQDSCAIYDLVVDPGNCVPGTTGYSLLVNFKVLHPGNDFFEVWASNGQYLGIFPLNQLPLTIPVFPASGGTADKIRICINDQPDCCAELSFPAPDCSAGPCSIVDLTVQTGDCTSDSTYQVWIDFEVNNPGGTTFGVWANGSYFGSYPISQLPVKINEFPWNGGNKDNIRVCVLESNDPNQQLCCKTIDFDVPDCLSDDDCDIVDLWVEKGDCTSDSTYQVQIGFEVLNPTDSTFGVWANGNFLGYFSLSQLPLTIDSFPWGGGMKDVVKVCITSPNAPPSFDCCASLEFKAPGCVVNPDQCVISDIMVDPGDCTSDSTYRIELHFWVDNPPSTVYRVYANGALIGSFPLSQLPLIIDDFPWGGGAVDVLEVCIPDPASPNSPGCCAKFEIHTPDCLSNPPDCLIDELTVEVGGCTSDSTYVVKIDFDVVGAGAATQYGVWANGVLFGVYPLTQVPLVIQNFPWNGGQNDEIKICLQNANSFPPFGCCKTIEYKVPACLQQSTPCEIDDLVVDPGGCTSDSTYEVVINFKVLNSVSSTFGVWANGVFLGFSNLSQLPLTISDFPWDGGQTDKIKVCMVTMNSMFACCKEKTFDVPDCLNSPCDIDDLQVLATPCLCGQFFAVLSFTAKGGSPDGFNIKGNGVDYGNFQYGQPQPIILGPLNGDGTTNYGFVVSDLGHPNCAEDVHLGVISCSSFTNDPAEKGTFMQISPNPATNLVQVQVQTTTGTKIGQADVEILAADGRRVRFESVADGAFFSVDVSQLPAGLYHMVLYSQLGRIEGSFSKL